MDLNIEEAKNKLLKLNNELESIKKYINFGSDINIIEIEEAIESYKNKINKLKEFIQNNEDSI